MIIVSSKTSSGRHFQKKPTVWTQTLVGSALLMAVVKLHPVQRALTLLEMHNIIDYFKDPKAPYPFQAPTPKSYSPLNLFRAWLMCYFGAIKRIVQLGKRARQDYFALNRFGCFSVASLPRPEGRDPAGDDLSTPLVIIPGLNTPPVFFQEMHRYFTQRGVPVSVLELPNNGLTDIATASEVLHSEIERMKACCNTKQVNVIGHCLGGIIGHYYLSTRFAGQASMTATGDDKAESPIAKLVTLSTGFLGSDGVKVLKEAWMRNHPTAVVPRVFDELIEWNRNAVSAMGRVAYHNFITVWDFVVYFQDAILKEAQGAEKSMNAADTGVTNHLIDDCDVDHLTIALHPKMLQRIEKALLSA